ncbi:hypothetical protein niasHT_029560 [Heterodera trifolii]|uniref:Uncharacterized protein n=1 Tax=Heterodera trifolii TaxID=157864 RepID=A0ABD2JB03_9BILA
MFSVAITPVEFVECEVTEGCPLTCVLTVRMPSRFVPRRFQKVVEKQGGHNPNMIFFWKYSNAFSVFLSHGVFKALSKL